ncbi:two-component sensor histidine kinase [Flexivirga endophytica]|uniref:Sensor histidine kinase MtrB n=1 Tax=Flexivirga endophytica TaxID=1849103 RepID=A0A916TE80_9MICO|nr:MtrAB system histidine kinase MtrB [Flexivirga endophytica]GGB39226.1 two-component sensor histidine kinase [Flexivirga endophytica]GHB47167.1 two-component sensor histidine kinase [Flexivirga endophytica]
MRHGLIEQLWGRTERLAVRCGVAIAKLWRRSLHFRVVTITVFLGLFVALGLGTYMYQRIAGGLASRATSIAEHEALNQRSDAQSQFNNAPRTDIGSLRAIAQQLAVSVGTKVGDQNVRVVITRSPGNTFPPLGTISTKPGDEKLIPSSVRGAVRKDPAHAQLEISTMKVDGREVPSVVVGARIAIPNAGNYDFYLVAPMTAESQMLGIVRTSFLLGGLVLTLLLAGIAYLVTRMVVTPVRDAAHVSERLTAGALNERMQVSGEDDLARLATSFNAMADSLQRQIRQLEDLSKLQQRFTSDVSHELRTPLTTIRMAVDMIHASRADFAAPVSRSAELLSRELDRFETLLTDLLEISRFDAGATAAGTEPVDLRDIVTRVVDGCEQIATAQGVKLRVHSRRAAIAPMDARRIERIVRNLVTNAIEHAERKPVDITVGANPTAVAVAVRDYGVGLRPGDADQVFNRFWRADPARARTTGGTGLGLSIALEDARLHDGWLQAWGEPGNGACFRLTLPVRSGQPIGRSPVTLAPDDSSVGLAMPSGNSLTIGTRVAGAPRPGDGPGGGSGDGSRDGSRDGR